MARPRVLNRVSPVGGFLLAIGVIVALVAPTGPALAADLGGDPSIDSKIELTLRAQEWANQFVSITMSTKLGETTLTVDRDGTIEQATMPYDECAELWQYLLERDIGEMGDAAPEVLYPDQATFTYTFQDGSESHTFSAYAVDFIPDTRYRDIAMAITTLAERYRSGTVEEEPVTPPSVRKRRQQDVR